MSNRQPISTFLGIAAAVMLEAGSSGFGVNPSPEDTNGDGTVNVLDLTDLLLCFGQPAIPGCVGQDINGDGTVNVQDLIALMMSFGPRPVAQQAAPEGAPESVCFIGTGLDPLVALDWQELTPVPRRGWAEVDGSTLHLVVSNRGDRDYLVDVSLHPWGIRAASRETLPRLTLPARMTHTFAVDLSQQGFDLAALRSPGCIRALARVFPAGSPPTLGAIALDQSFSPTVYFHGTLRVGGLRLVTKLYLEDVMQRTFQSGNLPPGWCPGSTVSIPDPQMFIDAGDGDPDPDDPDAFVDPVDLGSFEFCFRIPVDTKDSGIGEDFGFNPVTIYPAAHARVIVKRVGPPLTTVFNGTLDEDGCVTFQDAAPAAQYIVRLFGQSIVPRTDNPAQSNTLTIKTEAGNQPSWVWCWDFDAENTSTRTYYLNPSRLSNLLAIGTFCLRRFSDGVSNGQIVLQDIECQSSDLPNSCYQEIHPDHNHYKYAIAHEVGHDVIYHFLGNKHLYRCGQYTINSGGTDCEWPGAHALHSKEYSAGAMGEAFAHFYAGAVWNQLEETNGFFHYYKDDYKDGDFKLVNLEQGPTGGDTSIIDECTGPTNGFATELDWARVFWNFMTDGGAGKPTKLEFLEQLALVSESQGISPAWNLGNTWHRMRQAILTHPDGGMAAFDRFNNLASIHGIDANANCFVFNSCPNECTDSTPCFDEENCPCSSCK